MVLQVTSSKAQALMADRTVCQQYCRVDAILSAAAQDLRAINVERMPLTAIGRCAVKPPSERANSSRKRHRAQCFKGEPATSVLHARVYAVDGKMRNSHVVLVRGVAGVHAEELGCGIVRRARPLWTFVWLIGGRGCDEGNATLVER